MMVQIVVFSRKTNPQSKKNFAFRSAKIAQKFCEWKPYGASSLTSSPNKPKFNIKGDTNFIKSELMYKENGIFLSSQLLSPYHQLAFLCDLTIFNGTFQYLPD